MLQPTARVAGSAACRAQLQCVLRSAPSRPSCRQALEAAGPSRTRAPPALTRRPRGQQHQLSQTRWFSVSQSARDKEDNGKPPATDSPSSTPSSSSDPLAAIAQSSSSSAPSSTSPESDVPWYLKVDVPKHATLTPQDTPLPDVPHNAPSLMLPLLTFVAEDLGLDDLELLDLRALDPPAALGPDLLMLFGSARSERHLHVSADRLVRWLRKYGVSATADGLLGRNELKIKLRRKARKAKLLGNIAALEAAAAASSGNGTVVDDGISTQWVCLHAGTLGRSAEPEGRVVDAEGRTSGFGSVLRSAGTTVVVQMFTEAKRRQLDLETLWSKTLQRSVKKRIDAGEDVPAAVVEEAAAVVSNQAGKKVGKAKGASGTTGAKDDPFSTTTPASAQHFSSTAAASAAAAASGTQQQRREFSTSARRLAGVATSHHHDIVAKLTQPWLGPTDLPQLARRLAQSSTDKTRLQQQLMLYLDSLPRADAVDALGTSRPGSSNSPKSAFLVASEACMRGLPPADTWAFRALVHAKALTLGHADYKLAGLVQLIEEMQRGGLAVDRDQCVRLLQGLFSAGSKDKGILAQQKETALSLLDTMYERGQATLAGDVLVAMVAGLARTNPRTDNASIEGSLAAAPPIAAAPGASNQITSESPFSDSRSSFGFQPGLDANTPVFKVVTDVTLDVSGGRQTAATSAAAAADDLQTTLESLLRQADLPCLDDSQLMALLDAYVVAKDWPRFWAAWRMPAQHGRVRSAALYAFLFRRVAQTNNQARCLETLRRCFQEMLHEEVPVSPTAGAGAGAVRTAIKQCIRVADPQAEAIARNLSSSSSVAVGVDGKLDEAMARRANRECVRLLNMMG